MNTTTAAITITEPSSNKECCIVIFINDLFIYLDVSFTTSLTSSSSTYI